MKSNRVHLVLSTNSPSVASLENVGWGPFSGMGQAVFSFLVQNHKDRSRKAAERVTVSTISFIQANLQHNITAPTVLTRTVTVKGIDVTLIQEA